MVGLSLLTLVPGQLGGTETYVRELTRWYVEPVFADQRGYNDALLKLVDELAAEIDRLRARVDELEARP